MRTAIPGHQFQVLCDPSAEPIAIFLQGDPEYRAQQFVSWAWQSASESRRAEFKGGGAPHLDVLKWAARQV